MGRSFLGKVSSSSRWASSRAAAAIGLLQPAAQILGLDAQIHQISRPLHQGAAQESTAGQVSRQGQLGGGGLGVEGGGAVHDKPRHTALQQPRLPPQPLQHAHILKIDAQLPQREGKEELLSRQV